MEKYKLKISSSAAKSLKKIPKKDLGKVVSTIQSLALNPRPPGSRKLSAEENAYRVRQGVYRIIYQIEGKKLLILVLKIGHRKNVY